MLLFRLLFSGGTLLSVEAPSLLACFAEAAPVDTLAPGIVRRGPAEN